MVVVTVAEEVSESVVGSEIPAVAVTWHLITMRTVPTQKRKKKNQSLTSKGIRWREHCEDEIPVKIMTQRISIPWASLLAERMKYLYLE